MDRNVLESFLKEENISTPLELIDSTTKACEKAMPKKGIRKKAPVYWWNEQIREKRDFCTKCRRKYTRQRRKKYINISNKEEQNDEEIRLREEYKSAKIALQLAISKSKEKQWKELCEEVDKDTWGLGYRIVTNKLRRQPPSLNMALIRSAVDVLFPIHDDFCRIAEDASQTVEVTTEEIKSAAKSLCELEEERVKARGLDKDGENVALHVQQHRHLKRDCPKRKAIDNDQSGGHAFISHTSIEYTPQQNGKAEREIRTLVESARSMISSKNLPKELWAEAINNAVYIINRTGKSKVEDIMIEIPEMTQREGDSTSSESQETEDEYLELENVSNPTLTTGEDSSSEEEIVTSRGRRVVRPGWQKNYDLGFAVWGEEPKSYKEAMQSTDSDKWKEAISYLEDRRVKVKDCTGKEDVIKVSSGVPQGSILGPTLWNILYDGVLHLKQEEGIQLVGFADDLALVVVANTEKSLMTRANTALRRINAWMKEKKLALAPEKTEAIVFSGRRKLDPIKFVVEDMAVAPKEHVKYLGVWLDKSLNYKKHVEEVAKKSQNLVEALHKLMPTRGGPRASKRRVLASVAHSVILYGAPIYENTMRVELYRKKLEAVQRRMAIGITPVMPIAIRHCI
ncbi:uncharacterized protein LOC128198524 [Bicyclus anynana]|uniref:Uncharacterized protein LOC128198524 n=1 Tax=Bicyclus anynana TaxID=110368 RepID=A0ABM3LMV1_BICAN|nr:uncharacterized protein LOC128198524 [Bicyclus anynana]